MAVARYVLRRIAVSLILLLFASVVIFFGMHALPGNPLAIYEGTPGLSAQQISLIKLQLGFDNSLLQQYATWLGGALHGNLGRSYFNPEFSTSSLIAPRIIPTLELAFCSILIALIIAIPLAMISAHRPFSLLDRAITGFCTGSVAIPSFWLAVLLISVFSVHFSFFPTRGYVAFSSSPLQNLRLVFLPALTMGLVCGGIVLRFLRASLLDELTMDYVRTARGKGLSSRQIMYRHALPNASLPALNVIGVLVGSMVGGIVIIEYIFGWPGLGTLMMESVLHRDYEVLEALLLLAAAAFICSSLAVDMISFAIDPRLRVQRIGKA